uniref:Uncharacterized protein n=1 Tax=Saccharum spontaneum TaxID=62335 RepID=A0A678TAI1_SACSP|nr:hypothetical protein SS86M13_000008 [Saccharum spontaneum]
MGLGHHRCTDSGRSLLTPGLTGALPKGVRGSQEHTESTRREDHRRELLGGRWIHSSVGDPWPGSRLIQSHPGKRFGVVARFSWQ